MIGYKELDPTVEYRAQFAFKGKREHISKINISNIAYPSQHIDIDIRHGSRDYVIILYTIKIMFNLDTESTDKSHSVANNVGRALVKKRYSCLDQKILTQLLTHIFTTLTKTFT